MIWYNRNKLIHEENSLSPLQVLEKAKNIVEDFKKVYSWDFPSFPSPQCGWAAPPLGFYKVNVDGASSIDGSGVSGVGVIIRDELGFVVAALCKALPMHHPAEWTEFLALEQGVLLAKDLNLSKVFFESNASSVISVVSQVYNEGIMGHLVQSIQSMKSFFSFCSFSHVKKEYNMAAHELAQFAKCNQTSQLWKGVIPPSLLLFFQFGLS